jgi:hypothetical protein
MEADDDEVPHDRTKKLGFNTLVHDRFAELIQRDVIRLHYLAIHSSFLISYYVRFCFFGNTPILLFHDKKSSQRSMIYRFYKPFLNRKIKNGNVVECKSLEADPVLRLAYNAYIADIGPSSPLLVDFSQLSNHVNDYAVITTNTNLRVNVTKHYPTHVRKFVNSAYWLQLRKASGNDLKTLQKRLRSLVCLFLNADTGATTIAREYLQGGLPERKVKHLLLRHLHDDDLRFYVLHCEHFPVQFLTPAQLEKADEGYVCINKSNAFFV